MPPGPIHKKCLGLYPHRAGSKAPLPGGAAAENDGVVPLMEKLLALLQKRPVRTPYDYQEYEVMRSQYLMPYEA